MIKVAVLGSTGSIGSQALEIIQASGGKLKAVSLAAGSNATLLQKQIAQFKPKIATLEQGNVNAGDCSTKLYFGEKAYLNAITEDCDVVLVALTGFAGYHAIKRAIELKKNVAVACKEAIVCGGSLLMQTAKENGVEIYPVDSEHSAIWQCLNMHAQTPFEKLIITASGGAFRDYPIEKLNAVTPELALNHPTWKMGKKITVDCATLMNKGFEVIEAMHLFNTPLEKIEVLLHRESIIHSMVAFKDGSVIAQLGNPTMKVPISLALYGGKREQTGVESPDFNKMQGLTFGQVDMQRYPCFALAIECAKKGGLYPCALSSADEEAVALFLQGKIKFNDIYGAVSYALDKFENGPVTEENLILVDSTARKYVGEYKCQI